MLTNNVRFYDFNQRNNNRTENNNCKTTGTGTTTSIGRAREDIRKDFSERHNSVTIERAHALKMAFDELIDYYETSFRTFAGLSIKKEIRDALVSGCSKDIIMYCFEEAEAAPTPSWFYARAILRRCLSSGILSAEDLARDQSARSARKAAAASARNPAGNFLQRTYDEQQLMDEVVEKFDFSDEDFADQD